MNRQEALLDAAIRVLGSGGPRQLTHRAVDAEAGVPVGSTSNYFRTREALVDAVVARFVALDREEWARFGGGDAQADGADLVRALDRYVRHSVGAGRVRTLARYALFLEATARPRLRRELGEAAAGIAGWGVDRLRRLGYREPERHCRLLLDYLDGVILHHLAYPDPAFDPVPGIEFVLGRRDAPAG